MRVQKWDSEIMRAWRSSPHCVIFKESLCNWSLNLFVLQRFALTFLGVNSFLRKIAKSLSSTTQLTKRLDGRYAIHTTALKLITQTVEFTPNQEFEEKTADGRKVKSTIVFEENKLIHTQHGEKPFTVERRFFNDEMIAVATYGDIVSTSWSQLVE